MTDRKTLNRIKIVMIEQKRYIKWLAAEVGVTQTSVSRWCSNLMQPSIKKLFAIAEALNVDVRTLLEPTKRER